MTTYDQAKYDAIAQALETLTTTTVWKDQALTGAKPGCHDALMEALFGLEVYRYASGNIAEAYLDGEKISNNRASNLQNIDLNSDVTYNMEEWDIKPRLRVELGNNFYEHPLVKQLTRDEQLNFAIAIESHQLQFVLAKRKAEREAEEASKPQPSAEDVFGYSIPSARKVIHIDPNIQAQWVPEGTSKDDLPW